MMLEQSGPGDMYSGPHMVARKEAEVVLFQMLPGSRLWKLQPPQPREPQLTFMCRLRAGKINSLSLQESDDILVSALMVCERVTKPF